MDGVGHTVGKRHVMHAVQGEDEIEGLIVGQVLAERPLHRGIVQRSQSPGGRGDSRSGGLVSDECAVWETASQSLSGQAAPASDVGHGRSRLQPINNAIEFGQNTIRQKPLKPWSTLAVDLLGYLLPHILIRDTATRPERLDRGGDHLGWLST